MSKVISNLINNKYWGDKIMSKIKISSLIGAAAILLSAQTTPLMAGSLGVGIQGAAMSLTMDGKETLKGTSVVSNKTDYGTAFGAPSGYLQYRFGDNGFVVGIEKIYGSGSLGSKTTKKNDNNASTPDVDSDRSVSDNIVKASIEDHVGAYIESPGFTAAGLFAKIGYSTYSIETAENLATGSVYGDLDVDAITYGIGVKGTSDSGIHLKAQLEYTDFDNMQFIGSGDTAGQKNTIDVTDIEAMGLKISVGYQF
jgi:hypothetical protein